MVSQKSQNVAMVYNLILFWSCDPHKALCPRICSYKLGVCLVCQKETENQPRLKNFNWNLILTCNMTCNESVCG